MTYLFLDTNIFLHFRFFIEIPWKKIIGDDFTIVIAPIVLDEIDKHKRHINPKISNRAKQVLSKVELINSKRENYPLVCLLSRPKQVTFDVNNLDRQEQDDSILAIILEFKEIQSLDSVKFISHDTGPRLRAASLSIDAFDLSEEYLLAEEKSADQKLIEKLTSENNKLKNAIPKVSLLFKGEKTVFEWELDKIDESLEEYVETRLEKEQQRLPELAYEDVNAKLNEGIKNTGTLSLREMINLSEFANFGMPILSKEQVKKYNKSLNEYFVSYEKYLQDKYAQKSLRFLSLPIDIYLHNNGNKPALDIDVWMHFPDGFSLVRVNDFSKKPNLPKEPYRPSSQWDIQPVFTPDLRNILLRSYTSPSLPNTNSNKADIRKTNSYEVNIHRGSLKHFQSDKLDEMVLTYDSFEQASGFTIDYKLIVSNIPEPVIGQLYVKLKKGKSQ